MKCAFSTKFHVLLMYTMLGTLYSVRWRRNNRDLTEIPVDQIPTDVTMLELKRNEITELTDHTFINHIQITHLYLDQNKITNISSQFFAGILNLQNLQLGKNLLTVLPDMSLVADTLTHLDLSENSITTMVLSEVIMNKLDVLNLDENKLDHLTRDAFRYRLPNVRTLKLQENRIASIETGFFGHMTNLKLLYLTKNDLTEFNPTEAGASSNITDIFLNQNDIENLTDGSFKDLIHLEALHLNYNKLTEFDLGRITNGQGLPSLLTLNLIGNHIMDIPSTELFPLNITIFGIAGNDITNVTTDVSYSFANFSRLDTLNLDSTTLTQMPIFTFIMLQLETLILSNNKITSIPENYFTISPVLKVLNLENNFLTRFEIVNSLSFLEVIDLDDNMLETFPTLSSSIILTLKQLFLSNNRISTPINMTSIYGSENPQFNASSLLYLYLKNNGGAGFIPDTVWKTMPNLQILSLKEVGLSEMPKISVLTQLTHLHLQGNNITTFTDYVDLQKLTKLKLINLAETSLTSLTNMIEIANKGNAKTLTVHVHQNNIICGAAMCWIKYMRLKSRSKCEYQLATEGATLEVQLGRGSCLCENAWTKAQMVDLGCGLGTSVPVQPVSSTVDVRHASDGDPTTCVNLAAASMDYPLLEFTYSRSLVDVLFITVVGYELQCDRQDEFFLAVERRWDPPSSPETTPITPGTTPTNPGRGSRQSRCYFRLESEVEGRSHCDYECHCSSMSPCNVNVHVRNPSTRVICEIIQTGTLLLQVK